MFQHYNHTAHRSYSYGSQRSRNKQAQLPIAIAAFILGRGVHLVDVDPLTISREAYQAELFVSVILLVSYLL